MRIIDEHNEESPYLLEASGQTPPEDVGGVGGFIDFREIMLDTGHPEYTRPSPEIYRQDQDRAPYHHGEPQPNEP